MNDPHFFVDCLNIIQDGGLSEEIFEFNYRNTQYQIKVVTSKGVDAYDTEFDLYFLSIVEKSITKRCGYIKIYSDSDIGIIMDLNNYYPCVVPHHNQKGRVVLTAIIEYCQLNKAKLGINYLQLEDNSVFRCPVTRNSINLLFSNQLLGKLPYYMNLGFKPIHYSALDKIKRNITKMHSLTTSKFDFISFFQRKHLEVTDDILDLIQNSKLVIDVLKYISKIDCDLYASFHRQLYNALDLEELFGDEDQFIIKF